MSELAVITIQDDTYEVTEIPVGYAVIVIDESGEDAPVAVRYTDSGSDEGERVDPRIVARRSPVSGVRGGFHSVRSTRSGVVVDRPSVWRDR